MITLRAVRELYAAFMYVDVTAILSCRMMLVNANALTCQSPTCDIGTSTVSSDNSPEKECEKSWRNNRALYPEKNPQLLNGHERQASLEYPVEHEAEQAS